MISCRWKAKWFKTVGEYSMGFKVLTGREEIGGSLDKYNIKCDISPNQPFFINWGEREIRLFLEGRRIVS